MSDIRIAFPVIALVTSTLHASVNFDKYASAFGRAMRRFEFGIIEYGYETYQIVPSTVNVEKPDINDKTSKNSRNSIKKTINREKAYSALFKANKDAQRTIDDVYG